MSVQLSGKQCKNARLLLKWNVRELAFRCNVKTHAIDLFERGTKQLFQNDREQVVKALKKEGIEFLDFGEVRLNADHGSAHSGMNRNEALRGGMKNATVYTVDPAQMAALRAAAGQMRAARDEEDKLLSN